MKILIPASGGWNSTYTLLKALTDTSHEIVAPFYRWDYFLPESPEYIDRVQANAQAVTTWLKQEVRPFTTEVRDMGNTDENGDPIIPLDHYNRGLPAPNTMVPIRRGFAKVMDGAFVKARYCQHARAALAHNCVEAWIGLDNQNTHTDQHIYFWPSFNAIAPGVRFHIPTYIWDDPANENRESSDRFSIKRFSQYAYLPDALKLLVKDNMGQTEFYESTIVPSGLPVDSWDEWAELAGAYGESRDIANSETYVFGMNIDHTIHEPNYDKFLGKKRNHPARPGIDRTKESARDAQIRKS